METVTGAAARLPVGNAFESTTTATTGTNAILVTATDASGTPRTQSHQVSVSGSSPTYTYDSNGNLSQKVEGGTTWTYVWDAENRLKWVCNTTPCTQGAAVASFLYDALGRRVGKVAGGVTTTYTHDGEDLARQIAGGSTLKFVHGPGIDEPLAQEDGGGVPSYFHSDGLGSIVKMTSSAGAVTSTRRFDGFGNFELGTANGYAFTGREWDTETGLAFHRARYYDPTIGRFLSEDPIGFGGGLNFYTYVGDSPTNFVDPFGLYCVYSQLLGHMICYPASTQIPPPTPNSCDIPGKPQGGMSPYYEAEGYSGKGSAKNNPAMQGITGSGAIPAGAWQYQGPPYTGPQTGKNTMRLKPLPGNSCSQTKRDCDSFRMHGDSSVHPGEASEGCIILPASRTRICDGEVIFVE
jgi:RHS repeat-associated protein